jgi:acetyltransferase EpsM
MSAVKQLIIWGASGHAMVVADIVRQLGCYALVGFLDDRRSQPEYDARLEGCILGSRAQLPGLRARGVSDLIVAVGDCAARLELASIARDHGFQLASVVHPRATVAGKVCIGEGSVVCAGAVIAPGCSIGRNVIVNTSASVDHECVLEDGVHVSPGAHLGGKVAVRRGAWVGIGATVLPNVTIGASSILGAGAVLLGDLPPHVVAIGVPATVMRTNA